MPTRAACCEDRVSSLRKVNIYERQRYRHIVGLPVVLGQENGAAEVETPFLIVRIMREGDMDVFATGCYRDKVKPDASGALRFRRAHRDLRRPPLRHAGRDSVLALQAPPPSYGGGYGRGQAAVMVENFRSEILGNRLWGAPPFFPV